MVNESHFTAYESSDGKQWIKVGEAEGSGAAPPLDAGMFAFRDSARFESSSLGDSSLRHTLNALGSHERCRCELPNSSGPISEFELSAIALKQHACLSRSVAFELLPNLTATVRSSNCIKLPAQLYGID